MIIDAHTHIYENNRYGGVDQLLFQMKTVQVEKSIVIALPGVCTNKRLLELCDQYPNLLYAMVYPDFSQQDWKNELKHNLRHDACVGMKIHPRSQNIELSDPCVEKAFEIAEQNELPVEVDVFPWGPRLNSPSLNPLALHNIAQNHTKIDIILAHCGAPYLMEAMLLAKSNRNIFLDISFFLKYFESFSMIKDLVPLCEKIGYNRFLYGSDFPAWPLKQYYTLTEQIFKDISLDNWKMLTYSNAIEIFGIY
jgi:predicted TIM-barrel fold metal-dependent hydrolase